MGEIRGFNETGFRFQMLSRISSEILERQKSTLICHFNRKGGNRIIQQSPAAGHGMAAKIGEKFTCCTNGKPR